MVIIIFNQCFLFPLLTFLISEWPSNFLTLSILFFNILNKHTYSIYKVLCNYNTDS